ncbi:SRPBCC domain-containing protein [Agreia sp.]|uniref:SRPBCC family protein n=1 Tax=Agreia sp. TaxID=1872416 RepID=UPI0035BC6B88
MTVLTVTKDTDALTLTFIAEFAADVDRVWQVWEDPRQLERWWGPPTWPATFTSHELSVGSRSSYFMTGPDGTKAGGWWLVTTVDAPARLEFDDGFADADGNADDSIEPVHAIVTLESIDGGTRMTTLSQFVSLDQLEKLVEMGMQEGMTLAMGQIDDVLAA